MIETRTTDVRVIRHLVSSQKYLIAAVALVAIGVVLWLTDSGIAWRGVFLTVDAIGPGSKVITAAQLPNNEFLIQTALSPVRPDWGPVRSFRPSRGHDLSLLLLPDPFSGPISIGWFEDGTPLVPIALDVDYLRGFNGLPHGGATSFDEAGLPFRWTFAPMPRGVRHLTMATVDSKQSTPTEVAAAFPTGLSFNRTSRNVAEAILDYVNNIYYIDKPAGVDGDRGMLVDPRDAIIAALPLLDAIADGRLLFVKAETVRKEKTVEFRLADDGIPSAEQRVRAAWLAAGIHRRADADARAVDTLGLNPLAPSWAIQSFHRTKYLPEGSVDPLMRHLIEGGALGGDSDPRRSGRQRICIDMDFVNKLIGSAEPRERSIEFARRLLEASIDDELSREMTMSYGGYLYSHYPLPEDLVVAVNAIQPPRLRRQLATELTRQDSDLHLEGDRLIATPPRDVRRKLELEELRVKLGVSSVPRPTEVGTPPRP